MTGGLPNWGAAHGLKAWVCLAGTRGWLLWLALLLCGVQLLQHWLLVQVLLLIELLLL